jgi:glucokinase
LAKHVLLGDIGATNARFALASKDVLGQIRTFEVAKYPQFEDALTLFLDEVGLPVTDAAIAVAGPVVQQHAKLTNQAWTIDAGELKTSFGLAARIINDFRAVALSLPLLKSGDLVAIGGGKIEEGGPRQFWVPAQAWVLHVLPIARQILWSSPVRVDTLRWRVLAIGKTG